MNWALVLSLYFGDVIKGILLVLDLFLILFWACVLGLCTYYFKPHQSSSPGENSESDTNFGVVED